MKLNTKHDYLWLPMAIAVSVIIGIVVGNRFSNQRYTADSDRKLNTILNLIADDYVDDSVNINDLIEMSIPQILSKLDPHTVYFSAKDLKAAQDELNGSFSGIGISFQMYNDTITVVEVIPGGPSDKAGILAGDRIVTVNDSTFVGKSVDANFVKSKLRGDKNSVVKLGIKRSNSAKTLTFKVTRGDVPVNSVDAAYMIEKNTGYVKVNQFGSNTYDEFINALNGLKKDGAKRYIVDLRGNGGGYMEVAITMANEFLSENQLIVCTKGRYKRDDSMVYSDGNGSFQDAELVVLIDEYSASASEIFAGAIQDNDRGLIIGNRSFGKGLVQKQFMLPDSSAIRMTIARYYTPSGRCIQKPYKEGEEAYEHEVFDRYSNGELFSRDSIKIDKSKIFDTAHGRKVYGGGGIIPDIFVPRDTSGISSYYVAVINAGMLQQYAFHYADANRSALRQMKDYKQFLRTLPGNEAMLNDFVDYAAQNGIPARWYYIDMSRDLLTTQIKAIIARDAFGSNAYYPIVNRTDKVVEMALKAFDKHKAAFPITN